MARLHLIRHARPAAGWGEDPDPGLDEGGMRQAIEAAQTVAALSPRAPIFSSPLRRCRETAAPLSKLWERAITILPEVAEIPAPRIDAAARRTWLAAAMQGSWTQLQQTTPESGVDYLQWRRNVIAALLALPHDCVIFTHYIAINVAVGAAAASDRVVCFRPGHASITVLDSGPDGLRVHVLGREAETSLLPGR